MTQRFDARFDLLDRRLEATDHNALARLQNSILNANDDILTALHSPTTNTPIAGFPVRSNAIQRMTGAQVDGVLTALGLPIVGLVPAKRQQLRLYIGLKARPA